MKRYTAKVRRQTLRLYYTWRYGVLGPPWFRTAAGRLYRAFDRLSRRLGEDLARVLDTSLRDAFTANVLRVEHEIRRGALDLRDMPKMHPLWRVRPKVGRNTLCPCGTGRKYKRCCWPKDQVGVTHVRREPDSR